MTLLHFETTVLTFPIELKRQATCHLKLFNITDKQVAFWVKTTNPKNYMVRPSIGVLSPQSTCSIAVTMKALKNLPADMQCKDKFLIQSTIAKAGVLPKDLFSKDLGIIVEKQKFHVAYVLSTKQPESFPDAFSDESSSFDGYEIMSFKELKSMITPCKEVRLNLLVDNDNGKVICAESNGSFIDILLSFLRLSIGSIVHLLDANAELGCVDKLCKSIGNLSSEYLNSSDQSSLLCPKRSLGSGFWNIVNCCKSQATKYFLHRNITQSGDIYCNHVNFPVVDGQEDNKNGLLFLKEDTRYIIRDDLLITPISKEKSFISVCKELGIHVGENLQEMSVTFTREDGVMKNLLKRSLVSLTPLSDIFLPQRKEKIEIGNETRVIDSGARRRRKVHFSGMKIKILKSTVNPKVLYAETGADFVNLLFNLLTYHVGSFSYLPQGHPIICFHNLCRSVNAIELAGYFKSERCKNMLLSSELPNKLCDSLLKPESSCKQPNVSNDVVKGHTFIVTDDLNVTPISGFSILTALREFNCSAKEVEECKVVVGRNEVEDLVVSALTSKMALSRTFLRR